MSDAQAGPSKSSPPAGWASSRRNRFGVAVAIIASAAVVGFWQLGRVNHASPGRVAPPPAPVVTAIAAKQDVPVYLTGIGAVRAFNTVTVKPRVDGEIDKIAFTEGQDVAVGDLLAEIDPRPFQAELEQARAQKARDEAQLANARRDFDRSSKLVGRGYATQQIVDTEGASVAALEAAIRGDQAQIDYAKVQLDYTRITAPIAGRTGIRLVDQGNVVHAADSAGLVVITQVKPISVVFTLPEDSYDAVKAAMGESAGKLAVLAYARASAANPRAEGALLLVNNEIDRSTATLQLKAEFPNQDLALWPGQFVNIHLMLGSRHDGVVVPAGAAQRGPAGLYAYVVTQAGVAEMKPIEVAQNRDGLALVTHGLAEGDRVVVDGQYKLRPGAPVMEQAAGKSGAATP
jgi:RND family efflux transporter MFP subunit